MAHRVLIVDDHPVMREGYRSLLRDARGLTVAAEATTAEEAFSIAADEPFDVAVVDLSLPGVNGIEFIKRLRSFDPDVRVLVVSAFDEEVYAERALRAGARGYLMKRSASGEFVSAIRAVLNGEVYLSSALRSRGGEAPRGEAASIADRLTDRELEVFEHFGRGRATKDVADLMGLSLKTIESHRANIRQKLSLGGSAEFVRRAVLWVEEVKAEGA